MKLSHLYVCIFLVFYLFCTGLLSVRYGITLGKSSLLISMVIFGVVEIARAMTQWQTNSKLDKPNLSNKVDLKTRTLLLFFLIIQNLLASETPHNTNSMNYRDSVLEKVKEYKVAHGVYPDSLFIPEFEDQRRELLAHNFFISSKKENNFVVGYFTTNFKKCTREIEESEWKCEE